MARFVVDLGDLPLTDAEHNGIASAIHAAVIGHLATIGNAGVHAATKQLTHAGMAFLPPDAPAAGAAAKSTASAGKPPAARRGVRKPG